jgi:hypothetical protein
MMAGAGACHTERLTTPDWRALPNEGRFSGSYPDSATPWRTQKVQFVPDLSPLVDYLINTGADVTHLKISDLRLMTWHLAPLSITSDRPFILMAQTH